MERTIISSPLEAVYRQEITAMKLAVILTRFLKDYVESYFSSLALDCDLSYFIYNDFAHAGELYIEL